MVEVLSPGAWARREFAQAKLGDARRTRRAVKYAAAAAAAPAQSIPDQCQGRWKQTKGAYRLFDQPQVNLQSLQQPHRQQTISRAALAQKVVLWVSDTTTLSFNHPATAGLGPTAARDQGQGMLLHSTLGVSLGSEGPPAVLGLGHQQCWVRSGKSSKKSRASKKSKARDKAKDQEPSAPESAKWARGIEAIGTPPPAVQWVHVGDCESDCFEALDACRQRGSGFAIRACQNRQVLQGHPDPQSRSKQDVHLLFELLERQPMLGGKYLWVRGRDQQKGRWAKLGICATALTLLAPKNWPDKPHRKNQPKPDPLFCWAVRVFEIDPPAGVEPIEWVILTDQKVVDLESAVKIVFWYSCRWLIEEYHKCLKSGCKVEERQLEQAHRLEALVGILAVVAVRLLQLKHQAKTNPAAPAQSVVPQRYVHTLAAYLKQPPTMTVREFWRATAQLGGFLGRKGDGDPGWQTLWRGWQHLEILADGMDLAQRGP